MAVSSEGVFEREENQAQLFEKPSSWNPRREADEPNRGAGDTEGRRSVLNLDTFQVIRESPRPGAALGVSVPAARCPAPMPSFATFPCLPFSSRTSSDRFVRAFCVCWYSNWNYVFRRPISHCRCLQLYAQIRDM